MDDTGFLHLAEYIHLEVEQLHTHIRSLYILGDASRQLLGHLSGGESCHMDCT